MYIGLFGGSNHLLGQPFSIHMQHAGSNHGAIRSWSQGVPEPGDHKQKKRDDFQLGITSGEHG